MSDDAGPDGDPVLSLRCASHTYPDGSVGMHDADFRVHENEVVALVGGNGAGKSTLLEHLNGTLLPDEGALWVNGTEVTAANVDVARREVGFVFQDADTQLVAPTVVEDVAFGLLNSGVPPTRARERAREALETVGAAHLEGRIPHYLSGGEKRLVGLAGVLVLDPSVVVLDEPLAGLDPARSRAITDRIRAVHEAGASVVLSTHDLEFAAEVADRVCVVVDGGVVSEGTPREVFTDDALLARAGLHPPTAVRLGRRLAPAVDPPPVTEDELATAVVGTAGDDGIETAGESDGPRP